MNENENLQVVLRFLRALEADDQEAVLTCLHPDVEQVEFPNALVKQGATRRLRDLLDGMARGRAVVEGQRYQVVSSVVQDNRVALEVKWSARVTVPLGMLKAGDAMTARFAVFCTMKDGRIARQHNYDCFDPF